MRLPAPPLPNALRPKPRRPGTGERDKPLEQVKEGSIAAVDWVDERSALSGVTRWILFRKVPKGLNWFHTLGSAC